MIGIGALLVLRVQSKILITKDGHAKLTSFRRSDILDDLVAKAERESSSKSDNERWRAPEANQNVESTHEEFGIPSDIYGWAVTAASVSFSKILSLIFKYEEQRSSLRIFERKM